MVYFEYKSITKHYFYDHFSIKNLRTSDDLHDIEQDLKFQCNLINTKSDLNIYRWSHLSSILYILIGIVLTVVSIISYDNGSVCPDDCKTALLKIFIGKGTCNVSERCGKDFYYSKIF